MKFVTYYKNNNQKSNILQSTKWKPYLSLYDNHTNHLKDKKNCRILEIGVRHGGSLLSYLNIFNEPVIFGIDINKDCKRLEEKYPFKIFIGDESDNIFLNNVVKECENLDIVVDDGSHIFNNIYISFNYLFPILNNNGVYIIEDIEDGYIDINILLKDIQHVSKVIKYDHICFIFKDTSINDNIEIINNLNTIKYTEKDRIHIGNIKIPNFIPGKKKL